MAAFIVQADRTWLASIAATHYVNMISSAETWVASSVATLIHRLGLTISAPVVANYSLVLP